MQSQARFQHNPHADTYNSRKMTSAKISKQGRVRTLAAISKTVACLAYSMNTVDSDEKDEIDCSMDVWQSCLYAPIVLLSIRALSPFWTSMDNKYLGARLTCVSALWKLARMQLASKILRQRWSTSTPSNPRFLRAVHATSVLFQLKGKLKTLRDVTCKSKNTHQNKREKRSDTWVFSTRITSMLAWIVSPFLLRAQESRSVGLGRISTLVFAWA